MDKTRASTFMLLRLISVRLGSFAFILCKLASTLVGLGGSSKMGLTFSPFTTSATQNLIKCQPRNIITLAVHSHLGLHCSNPGRVYEHHKSCKQQFYPCCPCHALCTPCAPGAVTAGCAHRGRAALSWANSSFIHKIPEQLIGAKAALKAIVWDVIYCKGCFVLCLVCVKKGVLRTCSLY